MKLYIFFFSIIVLFASCSHTKPVATKTTEFSTVANKKISALLQDSQKTNASATIQKLTQAVAQNTNNPEPLYELAYAHMEYAQNNKSLHEHDLAIAYFMETLMLVPGNQAVIRALYNIYYDDTLHNRDALAFNNARDYFTQLTATSLATTNPPSLAKYIAASLSQEAEHQPNRQALRDILLTATQEQPHNANSYIFLAKIYNEDRYFSLALATLKLGAEHISDSTALYQAIASTYEQRADINGCSYEHPSDIKNAATYYKQVVPLNPNNQAVHNSLSSTLLDQNLYYLGLHEVDIALALEPSSENLRNAAQNYSMLGYNKHANELLERALGKGLSISDASYHEIHMNQGDWQTAATGFAAYIKARSTYSVYDLIKSDMLAQQTQTKPWVVNKKISLASDWEENLFNYWTKKINADGLKTLAHSRCEKTEYYFYTGYQDYRAGNIAQANIKFTETLNQNTYRFIERPLARYFLQEKKQKVNTVGAR
jgi:hypothetical protein